MRKFCVFILSHGRADRVVTIETLKRCGYSGDWFIVIDNEDDTASRYEELYGDKVIMFDKAEIAKRFDTADLSNDRRTIVFARNACFDIAEKLGYEYFLELDDDYTDIQSREDSGKKLLITSIKNADLLFEAYVDFLEESNSLTVAMAQGGDFIGGRENQRLKERLLRKAMNTFFCKTERRFWFVGRINEDVNTYCLLGQRGEKIFTAVDAMITQKQTQTNDGGMSDVYLDMGTYLKSFYSVMFCPSCVKISVMGDKHKRIHHEVSWNKCAPKILNERWKK